MKGSITVIGVEADGIRGLRLEEKGAQWDVVDSEFWPTGIIPDSSPDGVEGGMDAAAQSAGSAPLSGAGEDSADAPSATPDDRYEASVEALKEAAKRFGTHEVVLSMPLKSLLVKVVRTSAEERDRLGETAEEELGAVSPFPDESPVIGMETVAETDRDLVTVFAALPSAEAGDIGDALDEAKVRVTRTDVTALGWIRTLWPKIFSSQQAADSGAVDDAVQDGAADRPLAADGQQPAANSSRKVVLMDFDDGWDLVVIDDGTPSLLRGLGNVSEPVELGREVMLSLLRAGTAAEVGEIVIFSKSAVDDAIVGQMKTFAPVRIERIGDEAAGGEEPAEGEDASFGGVEGVALRTQEGSSLDVTPAEWAELRTEARFTKKLMVFVAAAAAGWALLMGVLFGVPFVYGQMTEHQKSLSKQHSKAYAEVKEMRDKVKLVQQYSDHARGSLEMLKAVSDRMPEGITLTSFSYRRGERLSIVGEAGQPTDVYDFKNELTEAETEDGERLFTNVVLTGPSKSRGVHKFSIEGSFEEDEEGK